MNNQLPKPEQATPANARKVFEGVIFDVYQWEQELYDGSTATFERLKRADTVVIVPVTTDGQILCISEEQPGKVVRMGLPGGRVDPGEDIESAARRELLEETGHEAEDLILMEAVQPYSKIEWTIYTYIAKGCRKIAEPKPDSGERITLQPQSFPEFLETITHDDFPEPQLRMRGYKAKLNPKELERLKSDLGV